MSFVQTNIVHYRKKDKILKVPGNLEVLSEHPFYNKAVKMMIVKLFFTLLKREMRPRVRSQKIIPQQDLM